MKQAMFMSVSLLAGLVGGVLGTRLTRTGEQYRPERVVRARSFVLVDEAGKAISIWGVNREGHTLLALLGSQYVPGEKREHSFGLDNPLNQRAAIGVAGDFPVLTYKGTDGKTRMMLALSAWQKPFLMMEDETGPRVGLGINQGDTPSAEGDDWALVFEPNRAWMGMFSRPEGGKKYVRGFLSIRKDKVKYP